MPRSPLGERVAREGVFVRRAGRVGWGSCRAPIVNKRVGQDTSAAVQGKVGGRALVCVLGGHKGRPDTGWRLMA
jgi:hypothetical protein